MSRHIGQRGPLLRTEQVKQAQALIASGWSQKDAARFFSVSPGALRKHIRALDPGRVGANEGGGE